MTQDNRSEFGSRHELSDSQLAFWHDLQLNPHDISFGLADCVRLGTRIDVALLQRAIVQAVKASNALSLNFVGSASAPMQIFDEQRQPTVPIRQFGADAEARIAEYVAQDRATPFDLGVDELARNVLFVTDEGVIWYRNYHHLVTDGFGIALLQAQVSELYGAYQTGRNGPALAGSDYRVYLEQQRRYAGSPQQLADEAFWKKQYASCPGALSLSTRAPSRTRSRNVGMHNVTLPHATRAQLHALADQLQLSISDVLVAAVLIYLHRVNGAVDLPVCMPVHGRERHTTDQIIGTCANVLYPRFRLNSGTSVAEAIRDISRQLRETLVHRRYHYGGIRRDLGLRFDDPIPPRIHVNVLRYGSPIKIAGERAAIERFSNGPVEDLSFMLIDNGEQLRLALGWNAALYERWEIESHAAALCHVAKQMSGNPEQLFSDVTLMDSAQLARMSASWNATARSFAHERCYFELIDERAKRNERAVAVRDRDTSLTYGELVSLSARLAHQLAARGVARGSIVGVCLDRTPHMIAALLAIGRLGAAYLPLDPDLPAARLEYMAKDAKPVAVIVSSANQERVREIRCVLPFEELLAAASDESAVTLRTSAWPDDVAYVIYTSGSTGKPKGVAVSHRNLTNLLVALVEQLRLGTDDVLLAVTRLSFDIAGLELFGPLIAGGTVAISGLHEPDVQEFARACDVTIMQTTPSGWRHMLESGWALNRNLRAWCGGEPLSRVVADELLRRCSEVWNLYGPTETTIWSTAQRIREHEPITVGRPIANTKIYVLDDHLSPVPPGVQGEIWIGGSGVALGYLGREALTASRFIPDPFDPDGGRMYRTGDSGRFRFDGVLEVLGRLDQQIKLRGFRIELGELEHELSQHAAIKACAVRLWDDSDRQELVAYFVSDAELEAQELRAHLKRTVPDYMIPAAFVRIEALPLNSNGKLDRGSLPRPASAMRDDMQSMPLDDLERQIAAIWAQVLGRERVGVTQSFFELGGDSILATRAVAQIAAALGRALRIRDLFDHDTVRSLAGAMRASTSLDCIDRLQVTPAPPGEVEISYAQQGAWVVAQMPGFGCFYNMCVALEIAGEVSVDLMTRALNVVVSRHDSLRTTFEVVGERVFLRVGEALTIEPRVLQVSSGAATDFAAACGRAHEDELSTAFDVRNGPLIRMTIVESKLGRTAIFLSLHHLICDAFSLNVLKRELAVAYEACKSELPARLGSPLAYRDFAVANRRWHETRRYREQIEYWKRRYRAFVAEREFPIDTIDVEHSAARMRYVKVCTDAPAWEEFRRACASFACTSFAGLMTIFVATLHRYSKLDHVAVLSPSSGRNFAGSEEAFGLYANMITILSAASPTDRVSELLDTVKATVIDAQANGEPQMAALFTESDFAPLRFPPIVFNYQEWIAEDQLTFDGADVAILPRPDRLQPCLTLLELFVERTEAGYRSYLGFDITKFSPATVRRICTIFGEAFCEFADSKSFDVCGDSAGAAT